MGRLILQGMKRTVCLYFSMSILSTFSMNRQNAHNKGNKYTEGGKRLNEMQLQSIVYLAKINNKQKK